MIKATSPAQNANAPQLCAMAKLVINRCCVYESCEVLTGNAPGLRVADWKEKTMPEMNAVIGYLADDAATAIGKGVPSEPLEISVGEGSNTYVRIQPDYIAGVWTGASKNGQTGVQVLLKENATVETITRGPAAAFLQPIKDPTFVPMRPPIFVIYIPPFVAEQLGR